MRQLKNQLIKPPLRHELLDMLVSTVGTNIFRAYYQQGRREVINIWGEVSWYIDQVLVNILTIFSKVWLQWRWILDIIIPYSYVSRHGTIPFLSKYFPANTASSLVTVTPSFTRKIIVFAVVFLSLAFVVLCAQHIALSSRVQPKRRWVTNLDF